MATPEDANPRRPRIVGDRPEPSTAASPDEEAGELTRQQAAAFAALVAQGNQSAITSTLEQMSTEQVRTLAIALASQVNAAETPNREVPDASPDRMCRIAVATAAQSFGTTREAILSADRHRTVADARAVAMTAARRGGMSLPAIASYFDRDHTTVMHAQKKVASNPGLNTVCTRIGDKLEEHYAWPQGSTRWQASQEPNRPSETLQLAALEQHRSNTVRQDEEEDGQRIAVSAAPAR